jgi:uncharacterized SAM-binding protein YcdF (DUF218 family)
MFRKSIFPIRSRNAWIGFFKAFLLGIVGIFMFAGRVYSELPNQVIFDENYPKADVIVVLTGGKGRIRKAFELFERGYGRVLYVSGTDRTVQMKELLKELKWMGPIDDSRIILEKVSTNTLENAEQLKKYVLKEHLHSVLLVTSVYHVRRAHYIFKKILPREVRIDVTWNEREPFDEKDWKYSWQGIYVTVSEFVKFFYAWIQLVS